MEALPEIDVHERPVDATVARAWEAVRAFVDAYLLRPAPRAFVAVWGLEPKTGFAIADEVAPRRIVLRGRHRFSRYELAFEVAEGSAGVTVSARSSGVFPRLLGFLYRALVIGTGGHRVVVRRMLARIAHDAERRRERQV